MRTVVHLSDLHFGRVHRPVLEPLRQAVIAARPNVVAISGDLTQRARAAQFLEARDFLATLPGPQLVVPGNHDVPLYNLVARFARPLAGFRRHITAELTPSFADDEIALVGVNTTRSLVHKGGRINRRQVEEVRAFFERQPRAATRIVVTHHPFDLPEGVAEGELVGRARMAMEGFAACRVDVLLAGHLHVSHVENTAERYRIEGHAALVIQAGTATSSRQRGELNAFNVLRIAPGEITVETHAFDLAAERFAPGATHRFRRTPGGWAPATPG
jgi:3',5'-cyclic AMP phosphodiesterase CpdA